HQCPAGVIAGADVAYFAGADQIFKCPGNFVGRCDKVLVMDLVEVDVIRAQATQAGLAGIDDMVATGSLVIDPRTCATEKLGGYQHLLSPLSQSLATDFLR